MEENELFGEAHEQEENGLFGKRHQAEQLNNTNKDSGNAEKELRISDVIKLLPSAIILAEKFAESNREHVVKCRIEKGNIANLGLYLGFIEGYNYVIEKIKRDLRQKIDLKDVVLRTFLEYGINECSENDLTKIDLDECAEAIVEKLTFK